jgi:hypothetical protein
LAKQGIPDLNHAPPPYSPKLSPPHFFLFPKVKSKLKRRFEDTKDIKRNVTKESLVLHAHEFRTCLQQLYERTHKWYLKEIILKKIRILRYLYVLI